MGVTLDRPISDGDSDAAVIAASRARPALFEAIFDRHFDTVHAYLSRRAGTTAADDLASATFLLAFEQRGKFRPESASARPWLLGIATNLLRNQRRSEQRSHRALGRLEPPDASMSFPGPGTVDVGGLLDALDPDQRDALLLYAWGELSYQEIALALKVPVGTVRSRLSRARATLRAELNTQRATDQEIQEMNG